MTETAARQLRHELLNQVNHIVGYAELLLEEGGDSHLAEIVVAGKQVMSAVQRILGSNAADGFDAAELRAALQGPLDDVQRLAGGIDPGGDPDSERFVGQISTAARRAAELIGGTATTAA
ncbi:MAG TPA: hypothetical protein VG795_10005, partial [Acidimicrobiia bacterium]|nr:hypothetical protein [Acidimicrobiia bacterium]